MSVAVEGRAVLPVDGIIARIEAMRRRDADRGRRQEDILAIRRGDIQAVAGDSLPESFNHSYVANLIDTAAHDLSEVMAPLPSISCASMSQNAQTKKDFANKRSLIANGYLQKSRLSEQMYVGADRYLSFGYCTYIVEPDFVEKTPAVRIDKSLSSFFALDYRNRVVQYVNVSKVPAEDLVYYFPEHAEAIRNHVRYREGKDVEIAEWRDRDQVSVLIPELRIVLSQSENILDHVPVHVVARPSIDNNTRGQFDDVIWVQIARAIVAEYTMSAVRQSVEAPIALPDDVQELEIGPYAAVQSKTPQLIGRVPLNIPSGLFPEQGSLAQEQRIGSRYPEGRSGNIDASIITGQGVQALMGTFDTQVQTFQHLNEPTLQDVISDCFEMDEKLWPNVERSIRVRDQGSPVEIKYTPSKDIKGDYSVDVSYGAVAGLDPNRSLIFLLQAVSGGFMSRETARKHMPVDLDHVMETERMELETIRESLLGSVAALSQAIPQMAAGGADPRQLVTQIAKIISLREHGKTIDEAITKVFAPPEPKEQEAPNPAEAALQQAQGGGTDAMGAPVGAPQSPGQDLLMGLAGITPSGNANLQSNVSTRAAVM